MMTSITFCHSMMIACRHQVLARSLLNSSVRNYSCITTQIPAHIFPLDATDKLISVNPIRHIFGESALGMDKLENLRKAKSILFQTGRERYISRMKEYLEQNSMNLVVREDFVNLLALAENEEELDLVEKIVVAKYVGTPTADSWGATLMRNYYRLNLVDRAIRNFKDTDRFKTLFNQTTSIKVLGAMLYNAERYADVLEVTRNFRETFDQQGSNPIDTIFYAACRKLNTPESFQIAKEYYLKHGKPTISALKTFGLIADLAIKQGQCDFALDVLAECKGQYYMTIYSLKALALLNMDRYEDLLMQMHRSVGKSDRAMIAAEVCDKIEAKLDSVGDPDLRKELSSSIQEIKAHKLTADDSLDTALSRRMEFKPRSEDSSLDSTRGRFRNDGTPRRDNYNPRYGQRSFEEGQQYSRRGDSFGRRADQLGRNNDLYGKRNDQFGRRNDFSAATPRNYLPNEDERASANRSDSSFEDDIGYKRGFQNERRSARGRSIRKTDTFTDEFSDDELDGEVDTRRKY